MSPQKRDITVRFGERLRELREAGASPRRPSATWRALDRTYVSGIERGKRNVAIRNVEKIATALDMTIAELTKGL